MNELMIGSDSKRQGEIRKKWGPAVQNLTSQLSSITVLEKLGQQKSRGGYL